MAQEKRREFRNETYWGRPVPGFGDPNASILIVGLAPAAHGANRTGRMFTGDRSGLWLYRALYKVGFANQESSMGKDDGLELKSVYVSAVVRCAPPQNKPAPKERDQCVAYLIEELQLLPLCKVIVCLGAFAWNGVLRAMSTMGHKAVPKPRFGHHAHVNIGSYVLLGCYHPSQQNTFTGRLTEKMLDQIFLRTKELRK